MLLWRKWRAIFFSSSHELGKKETFDTAIKDNQELKGEKNLSHFIEKGNNLLT